MFYLLTFGQELYVMTIFFHSCNADEQRTNYGESENMYAAEETGPDCEDDISEGELEEHGIFSNSEILLHTFR